MTKELLGGLAILLTFAAFFPYIVSIRKGKTRPHVFSWIIWGLATMIVFFAQMADGAGIGAWSIGLSGVVTLYIAWMAFVRRVDTTLTRSDWVYLILALASIPIWAATSNPFWAVILLTTIDTLGFAPTFRKAYANPYSEDLTLYVMMTIRNLVSIPALENLSWTTFFFPAVLSLSCGAFVGMVLVRRRIIGPPRG